MFAEKLKQKRKEAGLSQEKTAFLLEISKRTFQKWEHGERVPPLYVQRYVLNEINAYIQLYSTERKDG